MALRSNTLTRCSNRVGLDPGINGRYEVFLRKAGGRASVTRRMKLFNKPNAPQIPSKMISSGMARDSMPRSLCKYEEMSVQDMFGVIG